MNNVYSPPEKKLPYKFAEALAARAKTLLLATATPVQLHSMELWDLLYILSMNNPQVLGSPNIFGTIPDFIVDQWVTDMLEDKAWDENTVLQIIEERQQNPFTLKETTESLDTDWEGAAEVLNQTEAFRELAGGW